MDLPDPSPGDLDRPAPPPSWRDVVANRRPPTTTIAAVAVAVVTAAIAVAAWLLLRTPPPPPLELSLPYADAGGVGGGPAAAPTSTAPTALLVHAAGAVVAPGVVTVPAGSRVADVLAAAGGPAADADVDAVNLAAAVADGDRVWFPRLGEVPPGRSVSPAGPAGDDAAEEGEPLDLNAATVDELDSLPGIGPAIAAAIVEHRERDGPFASVDELLDVPGIGDAKLAQLRGLVRV